MSIVISSLLVLAVITAMYFVILYVSLNLSVAPAVAKLIRLRQDYYTSQLWSVFPDSDYRAYFLQPHFEDSKTKQVIPDSQKFWNVMSFSICLTYPVYILVIVLMMMLQIPPAEFIGGTTGGLMFVLWWLTTVGRFSYFDFLINWEISSCKEQLNTLSDSQRAARLVRIIFLPDLEPLTGVQIVQFHELTHYGYRAICTKDGFYVIMLCNEKQRGISNEQLVLKDCLWRSDGHVTRGQAVDEAWQHYQTNSIKKAE